MNNSPELGEDLNLGADLLYEIVEAAYINGNPLPGKIQLMKTARNDLNVNLLDAKHCVERMEDKYRKNLRDAGYFGKILS